MTLCGRCGEEIRHGVRDGQTGWWHRENVDHNPILGQPFTARMRAEVQRQLDLPRTRLAKGVSAKCPTYQRLWPPEVYTTRELELERYRKSKKFLAAEAAAAAFDDEDDDEPIAPLLPTVEVSRHSIDPADLAPRSGIRQIANLLPRHGWELRRLTHSRGPYTGANGELLSVSDVIVLSALGPERLDGSRRIVVASWRDGKFDFAYIGTLKNHALSPAKVSSTEMKEWIKRGEDTSTGTD